jgi:hypothetical protein
MNIFFRQIYQEVGASFSIPIPILKSFRHHLDVLNKEIPTFVKKFSSNTFDLVFIINATLLTDELKTYGPNIRKKANEVEFSIHIPYKDTTTESHDIEYFLSEVSKGITMVFNLYEVDPSGIKEAANAAMTEAR